MPGEVSQEGFVDECTPQELMSEEWSNAVFEALDARVADDVGRMTS